ncbi:hypothetical protein [Amycolatopsis minnesotensis]|uniref:Sporadically distributed protein, TIGR04141 family n=1 Tax=Amycolatopsis minnesotensis TaxID=337894 RepID=A0ABN2SNZ8_9PSEU
MDNNERFALSMADFACRVYISGVMKNQNQDSAFPSLHLVDLKPYVSVVLLECTDDEPARAFETLRRFLRKNAGDPGRADGIRVRAEIVSRADEVLDEVGRMDEFGVDEIHSLVREVTRVPEWAERDAGFVDVVHQMSVAVRRDRLVAVYSGFTSDAKFSRWIHREAAPYRFVPADLLAGVFRGDGRMLWVRGVHRRRTTKSDSKALGGLRLQDALDAIEDSTYAMTAAKVTYLPGNQNAVLRDVVTVSPGASRISWKRTSHFPMFAAAVGEVLDVVEKALASGEEPEPQFSELAVPESDLGRVRGAFEALVAEPDLVGGDPESVEESDERAEFLRSAIIAVRGEPTSAKAYLDVGRDGAVTGTLVVRPAESAGRVCLDVGYCGTPTAEAFTREVKEVIAEGDLLTVYYESGHLFNGSQVVRQKPISKPFPNLEFADFSGYSITKEKPVRRDGLRLHDAISTDGDDSLFAWGVQRFGSDWLLCDDGAGEVADYLHLTDDGTLTAIHVKAAANAGPGRRIAVTPFEEVVSQAEKNVRLLGTENLEERLGRPRASRAAAWHAGQRSTSAEFAQQLAARVATDRTRVVIVQPHLLRASHDQARADVVAGRVTRDTLSLALLDNLLHSTRRTVTAFWDDLTVIGCA